VTESTEKLALIGFFFLLLWVGKYTYHGKTICCMQQFCLQDLKFCKQPQNPTSTPKACTWGNDLVSLTIDNQKNGKWGWILLKHALANSKQCGCPVQSVIEHTLDLLKWWCIHQYHNLHILQISNTSLALHPKSRYHKSSKRCTSSHWH